MRDEIIEFSTSVIQNVEDIDALIDSYYDDIKDITETAGDIVKPVKAIFSIYKLARKRKFKAFLKSYADTLNDKYDSAKKIQQSKRLRDYLKSENNLNFIYESIDNAVNSKSIYCSSLLGYYTGSILSEQIEIGYKELITVEALKSLNDIELEMLIRIYQVANLAQTNRIDECKKLKPYQIYCEKTVQKLKVLQVLEEEVAGTYSSKSGWGTFVSTEIAEDLFDLIQKTGIDKKILKN